MLLTIDSSVEEFCEFFGLSYNTKLYRILPLGIEQVKDPILRLSKNMVGEGGKVCVLSDKMEQNPNQELPTSVLFNYPMPGFKPITLVSYRRDGKMHRNNKPALIGYGLTKFSKDKIVVYECWYVNGRIHNSTGSALRIFNGTSFNNYYYFNGHVVNKSILFDMENNDYSR